MIDIEKELGSWSFAFHLENMDMKDKCFHVGLFELQFQSAPLIDKPGKYALKLVLCELSDE